MNHSKFLFVFQYVVYALLLLLLYILQTVPGPFLLFRGNPPILVIPAAVVIAMLEGEFVGCIYGALAGLLCDMGAFTLFGFNGFLTAVCCIGIGLLVIYLMRCNLLGCLLLVFLVMLLRGSLEFLFVYGMWGYEGVSAVFFTKTLPVVIYSTMVSPLLFLLLRAVHRRFQTAMEG